jgi:hypothetical protein
MCDVPLCSVELKIGAILWHVACATAAQTHVPNTARQCGRDSREAALASSFTRELLRSNVAADHTEFTFQHPNLVLGVGLDRTATTALCISAMAAFD